MPKVFYCLKCSTAEYKHSRHCRRQTTFTETYRSGTSYTYTAHKLVDLKRKPYCSWERNYIQLRRAYTRKYNPAGWNAIGWYCPSCDNLIC